MRNLAPPSHLIGLTGPALQDDTFPLGSGTNNVQVTEGCDYQDSASSAAVMGEEEYVPHVAEGISLAARNEYLCMREGDSDIVEPGAAFIHGVGLKLGLYTARAQKTCGDRAGSCQNELLDAQRMDNWTVDYLKDDSCGGCRTGPDDEPHADYEAMQSAIKSVEREIVLTCEGHPDVTKMYNNGCCGNVRRIGTDLSPQWQAVMSLVDHAAGLWPFAVSPALFPSG